MDRQSTVFAAPEAFGRFSLELQVALRAALERARARGEDPPVAAFDADGTLWRGDASDDLLDWVHERGLLLVPATWPGERPQDATLKGYCDALCHRSRPEAYAWAAAVYAGLELALVESWAAASWEVRGLHRVNPEMAALVKWLLSEGVRVTIVSASPWWAVVPGARHLGIVPEDVFAVDVDRDGTRLTGQVRLPVTAGEGKVVRFDREVGRRPFLAAGNTVDDLALIEHATQLGFVIDPRPPHGSTADLAAIAAERGFLVHHTGL